MIHEYDYTICFYDLQEKEICSIYVEGFPFFKKDEIINISTDIRNKDGWADNLEINKIFKVEKIEHRFETIYHGTNITTNYFMDVYVEEYV